MKAVGLLSNLNQHSIAELVQDICAWLDDHQVEVLLDRAIAGLDLDFVTYCNRQHMVQKADCLIVLGGDGTLLCTARLAAHQGVPILGINLGHLGFLTEVDLPNLHQALDLLLTKNFTVEERMMIEAQVVQKSGTSKPMIALNDAVIAKGAFSRLIVLEIKVDGQQFSRFYADGVIISTPTGSTAYSLSAGGPLVVPHLDLMVITPICPHTLWGRPLVVAPDSEVQVTLLSTQGEVMLTMDGQHGVNLQPGDTVRIKKTPHRAQFIKLSQRNFFDILKEKLQEGNNNGVK